jgi:phosphoesterase RecJ-like protein
MNKIGLKKVAAEIRKHKKFLLSVHTSPEGDAIGSELALAGLLKRLGKIPIIVNEDPLPDEYKFLPRTETIKIYNPNLRKLDYDCLIVLDCSDLNRTGKVSCLKRDNIPVINIDHHISNSRFGDVNLVDTKASSASELIYELYRQMKVPLDRNCALLIYVGIMTDTGSFRYSNTTPLTHSTAAELMHFGLDVRMIYRNIYESIPFVDVQLLNKILSRVRCVASGRVAWLEVPAKMLEHRKISFDLSDHILSFMRTIKGVQVVALFRENLGTRNEIRFNLRSNGSVDVNKIACAFGGGGHKAASGCTIKGRLQDVRRKVIERIIGALD